MLDPKDDKGTATGRSAVYSFPPAASSKLIKIEGGEHHSLFLFDNGEVWGCGRCDANELGLPSYHPAQEGIKERRRELQEYREEKVTQRQEKLDEILQKGDKADEDVV
ncbi:hypothetical protein B9479_007153 [Cryptococcus floricola]|uniref:Uncharacterized protein n=1 Tax=Cryptococcus floricola TaxID=2591691 RepID=A0A5D3AL49_9TREE|nr:hypothetical protein B9479_007153 [Cryptococcus floricola]